MNMIKELLMGSGYWVLNKKVVQELGIENAFLLSNFAEAEVMMKDGAGWFYQTSGTVEEMTGLTRYKQDKIIDELIKIGVLKKDVRGMPAKRYFKIDYEEVSKLVFKSSTNQYVNSQQTSMQNSNKLVCKKPTTNKEHNNKEHNKKHKDNKVKDKDLASTKKTIDEQIAELENGVFALKASQYLAERIKKNNQYARMPKNYLNWAKEFDKLVRIEKIPKKVIKQVLKFCQDDDFWQSNILSGGKFRSKFPQLFAKAKDNGYIKVNFNSKNNDNKKKKRTVKKI